MGVEWFRRKSLARHFERALRAEQEAEVLAGGEAIASEKLRHMVEERPAIEIDCFGRNSYSVYLLWEASAADRPVYVGQSTNVLARLTEHLDDPDRGHRIARITLVRCSSADDMAKLKARLIDHYQPEINLLDSRPATEHVGQAIRRSDDTSTNETAPGRT